MMFDRRTMLGLAAALAGGIRAAHADTYPSRPVRLIVPFPPGGAFDTVGRPWAERIKPLLGTIVVENIGGGGGSLGGSAAARAQPDGYTVLLGGTQTHLNEALLKSRPLYDPVRDLDPIAGIATYPLCIAVSSSVAAATLGELVALAKSGAVRLSYGSAGVGSIQHLTGELLKSQAGTPDIVHVPYRGTGPALLDVVSGQIPMAVLGLTGQMLEFHRSGKIRILAVTGPKRLAAAEDLPTATESGLPNLMVVGSIGLLAPAGSPKEIVARIAAETRKTLAEASFRNLLSAAGMAPADEPGPDTFRAALAADIALWTPVVRGLGLKVD